MQLLNTLYVTTPETYLRLEGNSGESVAPKHFLPIAEEHGLLGQIDRWVILNAIKSIAARARAGKPVTLLVKISQASLLDEAMPVFIAEQLAEHNASGASLLLQVPESKGFSGFFGRRKNAVTYCFA